MPRPARKDAEPAGPAEPPQPTEAPEPAEARGPLTPDRDLREERRLRDSGGPEDVAVYACACGMVWEARVTASIACPHCGSAQAW